MPAREPGFGQVDLTNCDLEPIHIPGSIQHGVLLVVQRESLAVAQFAGDVAALLGVPDGRSKPFGLADVFDAPVLQAMVQRLRGPGAPVSAGARPSVLFGQRTLRGAHRVDVTVHAQGELGIIELEAAGGGPSASVDAMVLVQALMSDMQRATTLSACCEATAAQVRAAIGFDRVMIYQFLQDGTGKVVAQDKAQHAHSFLGMHFPASDIPRQARALYLRNAVRVIPDVDARPLPLQCAVAGARAEPLDMSDCGLRSVSPIHLEYLRNMGVGASMSLSIVIGGELWGMIACHHGTPRRVPAELRVACELLAQIFSMRLQALVDIDAAQRRIASARIHESLTRALKSSHDVAATLSATDTWLQLVGAGGAAVFIDGQLRCVGQTPPAGFIGQLVDWLHAQDKTVLATHALGADFPAAQPYAGVASGLLAVALQRQGREFVMWFRPEVVSTVTWAGDPRKPVEAVPHGDRLTPRKSFAAWMAQVHQQSAPWSAADVMTADHFRGWLLEAVLRQMDLARQVREAAFEQQSLLMAELDHRVKNTLASIQALVSQTKADASSLDDFASGLEQRIRAMAYAHQLLAASRWHGASVRSLINEELAPFQAGSHGRVRIEGDDVTLSPAAALALALVVHELTTNAAKYGALSTPAGRIDIGLRRQGDGTLELTWTERDGPPVVPPTRRGFGSVIIERSPRHELQGRGLLRFDPAGVSCVVTVPPQHLVAPRHEDMST